MINDTTATTVQNPQTDAPASMPADDIADAQDLADVLATSFRLFARGVADRRSAFRTVTVATVGADAAPRIRTMVLRRFDAAARCLMLHTDLRSGKLTDIAHTPRVAVHVYDARAKLQIRLSAKAQMHAGDAVARAAWLASAPSSRANYAISPAPGSEVIEPPQAPVPDEAGYTNFAVIAVTFDTLEWLYLHHSGHRRARFSWADGNALHSTWLVP